MGADVYSDLWCQKKKEVGDPLVFVLVLMAHFIR